MKKQVTPHLYAWTVLFAAAIIRGIAGPSLNGSSGLFLTPVSLDLGVGIGTLSLYLSATSVASLIWLPIAGNLFNRMRIRHIAIMGILLQTIPFAFLGLMYNVWAWYLLAVPLSMGSVLLVSLLGPVLIGRWFPPARHGVALGLLMTLTCLMGALLQPVLSGLISSRGWRSTYTIFGILSLVAMSFVTFFFLPDKKEEEPSSPEGFSFSGDPSLQGNLSLPSGSTGKAGKTAADAACSEEFSGPSGIPATRAVRSLPFAMLLLFMVVLTAFASFSQHISPYGLSMGFSIARIGTTLSVSLIGAALGSLLTGWLCDRIGPVSTGIGILLCGLTCVALFYFGGNTFPLFVCAALLHGFASSSIGVIAPVLTRDFFGMRDYEKLFSYAMTGAPIASIVLLPAYGFLYDALGSYLPILLFLTVALLLGILFLVIGGRSARRLAA